MSRQSLKDFRNTQQIKDEQINFLLADVEKNLEQYRISLEDEEKQLLEAKKIIISAKKSYDKTIAENKNLKTYIISLKQHFERQQLKLFESQKQKQTSQKYKKVILEEQESEIESDIAQESEIEEEIEPNRKKAIKKESKNNIFDYINQKNTKRHK